MRIPIQITFVLFFLIPLLTLRGLTKNYLQGYLAEYRRDFEQNEVVNENVIVKDSGSFQRDHRILSNYISTITDSEAAMYSYEEYQDTSNSSEQLSSNIHIRDVEPNTTYERSTSQNIPTTTKTTIQQQSPSDLFPPPAIFLNAFIVPNDPEKEAVSIDIIKEQLQQIANSYAATKKATVHFTTIAQESFNQTSLDMLCDEATHGKIKCIHSQHVSKGGELDTLSNLYKYCKTAPPNARAVYIHNKGSFHPGIQNTRWRRAMTDAVTTQMCLEPPPSQTNNNQSCNICGLQFAAPPRMFTLLVPGNFFAASCEYVNQLLEPQQYNTQMKGLINEAFRRRDKNLFYFGPKDHRGWVMGANRYTPEHWIGSHPKQQPCDLSVEPDYWFWQNHDHSNEEFEWSMFPRRVFNASSDYSNEVVRDNVDIRLRAYTLLPGLLWRFITLYGDVPSSDSWLYDYLPDGPFWRDSIEKYGKEAVDVITARSFPRNETYAGSIDVYSIEGNPESKTAVPRVTSTEENELPDDKILDTLDTNTHEIHLEQNSPHEDQHQQEMFPPPAIFLNAFIVPNDPEKEAVSIDIIKEQLQQIANSYAATKRATVHFTTIAQESFNQTSLDMLCDEATQGKIKCIHSQHVSQGGELDTLSNLYKYCQTAPPNARAVYIHNKGSFHPGIQNTRWRRAMTDAVTTQMCLEPPPAQTNNNQSCNICGLQFAAPPRMFTLLMPGNFFAASCEYVNQLLEPKQYNAQMKDLINEAFRRRDKNLFYFGPKDHRGWVMGANRYTPEHWIGSHPKQQPCDLSVEPDYWFWQNHDHSNEEFEWSMFPRRVFNVSSDFSNEVVRDNVDIRLRAYTLLPGLLWRFITLYGEVPSSDSWLYEYLPDGPFWRDSIEKYGKEVVDVVTAPSFPRNETYVGSIDVYSIKADANGDKMSRQLATIADDKTNIISDPSNCVESIGNNNDTDSMISNIEVESKIVQQMLDPNPLDHASSILGQTICHENGRFRSISNDLGAWNISDEQLIMDWEIKLIYLAIHDFHHRPAQMEYQRQQQCNTNTTSTSKSYQFQCPTAKYIVTALPTVGMGAGIRLSGIAHILMGIASDRIPLFVSNAPVGPDFVQSRWKLSSCDRGDFQCVFMPTSPCQLSSISELANATVLQENVTVKLRQRGKLPSEYDNERVLIVMPKLAPAKLDIFKGIHDTVRKKIYDRVKFLLEEWKKTAMSNDVIVTVNQRNKLAVLEAAAERILNRDVMDPELYGYGHRTYRIAHAALLYLLRPNDDSREKIESRIRGIIPKDLDPHKTIGMPIRGSDKCEDESTCLPFGKYMDLAAETWESQHGNYNHRNNKKQQQKEDIERGSLILTTEDRDIFKLSEAYTSGIKNFPLDLIVNTEDALQGSGNAQLFGNQADEIILSSLTAMKMQLHAGHVYGNCCSNFHIMIFDILSEGCGLSTKQTCLQETNKYNICCAWSAGKECQEIRNEYKQSRETPKEKKIRESREEIIRLGLTNFTMMI